ncbi:MAG: sigma-54-dependent transcriptional regulator, partial [Planctomycetota bacterium]
MNNKILLADDEVTFRKTFAKVLQEEGMSVTAVDNGTDAINAIMKHPYALAILDIQMPGADGIKVLREIMKVRPETSVIMITAYGTVEMAVDAIKLGASDYVMKPVAFEDILTKVNRHIQYQKLREENKDLKRELDSKFDMEQIVGQTPVMQRIFEVIRKVAGTKSNVLITGESGTGKELVARAIHLFSSKNGKRFVVVNCGAIPENLLESELFGHKKGSFTSAYEDKKGLFETANNGTLFLDEIGYMPMSCQVKLLRAVEQKQIMSVGTTEPINVDLRLIAATNRNLLEEIKADRFREDLYYRMNVVGIHLPPLRERKEDIPLLVEYFIKKYDAEMGKRCEGVSDDVMRMLMSYEWKGNIRELQNVIERAVIFAERDIIEVCDIGFVGYAGELSSEKGESLHGAVKAYEKQYIYKALNKYDWNKNEVAKALGV